MNTPDQQAAQQAREIAKQIGQVLHFSSNNPNKMEDFRTELIAGALTALTALHRENADLREANSELLRVQEIHLKNIHSAQDACSEVNRIRDRLVDDRDAQKLRADNYEAEVKRWTIWRSQKPWLAEIEGWKSQLIEANAQAKLAWERVTAINDAAKVEGDQLRRSLSAAEAALDLARKDAEQVKGRIEMALRCFSSMPDAKPSHSRDGIWAVWTDGCNCLRDALSIAAHASEKGAT